MKEKVYDNPQVPKSSNCEGCPRHEMYRCVASEFKATDTQPLHLLMVGDQPDEASAHANKPFNGHGGAIVRRAVTQLQNRKEFRHAGVRYCYGVQCESPDETAPTKQVMEQCKLFLDGTISSQKPKVIVALGLGAMRQLGLKMKHKEARGKFYNHFKYNVPILVTFSEKALLASPGLYETFELDLYNALNKAYEVKSKQPTLEELTKNYRLPTTVDQAVVVCDEIVNYAQGDTHTDNWAISVDTETTTLRPEKDSAKIIAFCFAWDKGKATTILYDHPHAPKEYLDRLPEVHAALEKVLLSQKPKIFHNAKFDLKFLEQKYGFTVNRVKWDTLLGEHLLDEDKKGNYGLKALTAGRLPEYCGYEERLQSLLEDQESDSPLDYLDKEIADQEEILKEDYPEYLTRLKQYREELAEYETQYAIYRDKLHTYFTELEKFEFCRDHLKGRQAVWAVEVKDWPKGKKGKPKKPVKKFTKPRKPKAPKKPKRPEDPRTQKEKQVSKDAGFENVPLYDLQLYGALDADVTRLLALNQKSRIQTEKSKVATLMRTHAVPASKLLGLIEYEGTKVDHQYLDKLEDGLTKIVEETEAELYDMAGRTTPSNKVLNLNNPAMLAEVVFNWGWKLPDGTISKPFDAIELTKKGQYSTSEKALRPLVEYEDEDNTIPTARSYFIERFLRYRKASKALNTFLANVRALSKRDGYLHTQFHLNGTGTGRLSSSDMNMQNLPKFLAGWNIKKMFIPDSDDFVFVNVDYKGAEVRVFTAYARDEKLIKAINEGYDMHSFFAHKVFNKPYEYYARRDDASFITDADIRKALDKERSQIKRVVFGILYGAGPMKISETIGVSMKEAKDLIDLLFESFPAIKKYSDNVAFEVSDKGYVETYFNRRRRFPLKSISRHKNRAVRQARNFKIQSTSSDIVVAQMLEMNDPLRSDFGGRELLTVHDSVGLQFPKKYIHQLEEFVHYYAEKRVTEKYSWLPVPFKTDIEVGPSYGEVVPLSEYLSKLDPKPKHEGIVEENEYLTELREDAFVAPH